MIAMINALNSRHMCICTLRALYCSCDCFWLVLVLHERLWLVTCWHKALSFFCADQLALSYNWKRHIIYLLTSRYINAKIVFFILQLLTLCMNKEQCYYDSAYSDADPMFQFEFSHLCKTNSKNLTNKAFIFGTFCTYI